MPEDPRPPVAIRITRPQATEDDFLEQELDTLTRTSVTLLGAQPRPSGVVLRFEIVLSSGLVVMRGEGRVVAFRPNTHQGLGGLTLRFTRLDSRTKMLVDRAAALRDRRRPGGAGLPHEPSTPSLPAPAIEELPRLTTLPPAAAVLAEVPEATRAVAPSDTAGLRPMRPRIGAPADREALLERLRMRAKRLDPVDVQRILQPRASRHGG